MNIRRNWLSIAAALVAVLTLVGMAGAVNAAFPAPQSGAGAPIAAPSGGDKGVETFDCSLITAKGIDRQMNLHAAAILAACGKLDPSSPAAQQSPSKGGNTTIRPSNLGGTDVDIILPDNTGTHVTQSESYVWANGQTVVANYNDSGTAPACYSGVAYSTDGGTTWHAGQPLCAGHGTNFGDPTVNFDASANLWVATDLASGCGGQGVGSWTSPDGITWTAAGCVMNSSQGDRNSSWVDNNASSPYYGTMYVSYNDFNVGGGALYVAHSVAPFTTWTPTQLNPAFIRDVQLTGAADGTVLEAAMNENGGGLGNRNNVFYRSSNGGVAWTNSYTGPAFYGPGRSASGYFAGMYTSPTGYFRHMGWGQPAGGGPQIAGQNVFHYVYAMGIQGVDPGNVMYIRSTDNGTTWSAPLQLNTDAGTHAQFMPSLSETPGGALLAAWFDERNNTWTPNGNCTPGNVQGCYEWYGRVSLDNGATWQADQAISDAISPLPAQPDANIQPLYVGDYDYNSGNGTNAYTTWIDGRTLIGGVPQQDVYFDKVPLIRARRRRR